MSKVVFLDHYFHLDYFTSSQLLTDLAFHPATGGAGLHIVTGRQLYADPGS